MSYLAENTVPQMLTSLILSVIIFYFVRKDYDSWKKSTLFIILPGLFGMFFKDIMFVTVFVLETGGLGGIRYASGKALFVHTLFESYASFISVPIAFLLVLGAAHISRKYLDIEFPDNWMKVLFWVTFINVALGVFVLDPLGF